MDQRRAGSDCVLGARHSGQNFVIDRDHFRSIARQRFGRGDHDGDTLADIAYSIPHQRRALGAVAFGAAHVLGHDLGIECAKTVGCPILTGQDGKNAGYLFGGGFVDGPNARVGVRRKDEDGVPLAGEIEIRDIAATPRQEARILLARDGLSDAEAHNATSLTSREATSAARSGSSRGQGRGGYFLASV